MMKFFTYKTCESQHFIAKTREIQYLWTLQCEEFLKFHAVIIVLVSFFDDL
jgi:hypothetical protein